MFTNMAGPGSRDDKSCELWLGPQARSGRRGRASVRGAAPTPLEWEAGGRVLAANSEEGPL